MEADTSFDRKGRCPVCRKDFQTCQHSYSYVQSVLKEARRDTSQFKRDVARLKKRKRSL